MAGLLLYFVVGREPSAGGEEGKADLALLRVINLLVTSRIAR
jgi:hypothetical protein